MDKCWSSIPVPDWAPVLVELHRFSSRKRTGCSDKCNRDGARTWHFRICPETSREAGEVTASTGLMQKNPDGVISTTHFQLPL